MNELVTISITLLLATRHTDKAHVVMTSLQVRCNTKQNVKTTPHEHKNHLAPGVPSSTVIY